MTICEPYFVAIGHNIKYSTTIARLMHSRGPDTKFIAVYEPEAAPSLEAISRAVPTLSVKCRVGRGGSLRRRLAMFVLALNTLVRRERTPDATLVLLAYEPWLLWPVLPLLKFRSILVVDHSCDYPPSPFGSVRHAYKWFNKWFVRALSASGRVRFVVHSAHHANLLSRIIEKPAAITMIEYGCECDPVEQTERDDGAPLVLIPGIWRRDKGIRFALEHFPRDLLEAGYRLVVAGHPGELSEQELRAFVEELGVSASVQLLPRYLSETELRHLHTRASYVLLPYAPDYRGGAGPLKDACGFGSAVLCSDAAGLGQLLHSVRIGFSYNAGEARSFQSAVMAMDEALRRGELESLRRASREYGRSISWNAFVEHLASAVCNRPGNHVLT